MKGDWQIVCLFSIKFESSKRCHHIRNNSMCNVFVSMVVACLSFGLWPLHTHSQHRPLVTDTPGTHREGELISHAYWVSTKYHITGIWLNACKSRDIKWRAILVVTLCRLCDTNLSWSDFTILSYRHAMVEMPHSFSPDAYFNHTESRLKYFPMINIDLPSLDDCG